MKFFYSYKRQACILTYVSQALDFLQITPQILYILEGLDLTAPKNDEKIRKMTLTLNYVKTENNYLKKPFSNLLTERSSLLLQYLA